MARLSRIIWFFTLPRVEALQVSNIRSRILGRQEDNEDIYEVVIEMLNIRSGPGKYFEKISEPLPLGTRVTILEARDRWSKVDVDGENDIEGWVYNKYIKAVQISG